MSCKGFFYKGSKHTLKKLRTALECEESTTPSSSSSIPAYVFDSSLIIYSGRIEKHYWYYILRIRDGSLFMCTLPQESGGGSARYLPPP